MYYLMKDVSEMGTFKNHRENISKLMYYSGVRMWKGYIIHLIVLFALPLFRLYTYEYPFYQIGYYNEYIVQTLCSVVFFAVIISWLICLIVDLRTLNWKYGVQDRQLILPCSRFDVILGDILFAFTSILFLYILQAVVYYLGLLIYDQMNGNALYNGFFLAVSRSELAQLFIPLNILSFFKMILYIIGMSMVVTCFGRFGFKKNKLNISLLLLYFVVPVIYFILRIYSAMSMNNPEADVSIFQSAIVQYVILYLKNNIQIYYLMFICVVFALSMRRKVIRKQL